MAPNMVGDFSIIIYTKIQGAMHIPVLSVHDCPRPHKIS